MENNRNFFITIALSVLILALWQYFYVLPRSEQQREAARIEEQRVADQKKAAEGANPGDTGAPASPGAIPNAPSSGEAPRLTHLRSGRRLDAAGPFVGLGPDHDRVAARVAGDPDRRRPRRRQRLDRAKAAH